MSHDIEQSGFGPGPAERLARSGAGRDVRLSQLASMAGGVDALDGTSHRTPRQIADDLANSPLVREWAASMARMTAQSNREFREFQDQRTARLAAR